MSVFEHESFGKILSDNVRPLANYIYNNNLELLGDKKMEITTLLNGRLNEKQLFDNLCKLYAQYGDELHLPKPGFTNEKHEQEQVTFDGKQAIVRGRRGYFENANLYSAHRVLDVETFVGKMFDSKGLELIRVKWADGHGECEDLTSNHKAALATKNAVSLFTPPETKKSTPSSKKYGKKNVKKSNDKDNDDNNNDDIDDNYKDIANEGGVVDDTGEKTVGGYRLLGLWMSNVDDDNADSREFWVGYRHCNRLKQIVLEERKSTFSVNAYKEFMESNDNLWLSMFPWRTVDELLVLRARHAERTWMTLWTMTASEVWPDPLHRIEFEKRRQQFLKRQVIAMWPITEGYYLVHLDEHHERGAFDRLSNGFICFPTTTAPLFFTAAQMQRLMIPERAAAYPWKTGVEGVKTIRHWRAIDRTKCYHDIEDDDEGRENVVGEKRKAATITAASTPSPSSRRRSVSNKQ
jgi:hypothetical protein